MMYADASVIVSAYLSDESDHDRWRGVILEGSEPVLSSELVRAEVASAFAAAARAGRFRSVAHGWRFEADCGPGGPIQLIAVRAAPVLARATRLAYEHSLYAMDAIHLAVALEQVVPLAAGEPIAFLTRDRRQGVAARALGFHDLDDPSFREQMAGLGEAGVFLVAGEPAGDSRDDA